MHVSQPLPTPSHAVKSVLSLVIHAALLLSTDRNPHFTVSLVANVMSQFSAQILSVSVMCWTSSISHDDKLSMHDLVSAEIFSLIYSV